MGIRIRGGREEAKCPYEGTNRSFIRERARRVERGVGYIPLVIIYHYMTTRKTCTMHASLSIHQPDGEKGVVGKGARPK